MIIKKLKNKFCYTAYTWTSAAVFGSGTKKPEKLTSLAKKVKKIAMSDYHNAVITNDNLVYTWGENSNGQLGLKKSSTGIHIKKSEEPLKVEYFEDKNLKIIDIVLGRKHTIALSDTGRVFSWGRGDNSKYKITKLFYPSTLALGHKVPKDLRTPKPIKRFLNENILQISTGNDFAMAVSAKNSLWVWGRGEFGVLGYTNKEQNEPVLNPFIEELKKTNGDIIKIDSCSDFSTVLFDNGKIFSFGNNDYGNLAIGYSQSVDTCDAISNPSEAQFPSDQEPVLFKDIYLSEQASAFLSKDNKVYFSGRKLNYYPKLFDIDYNKHNIIDFCASDKGVAVLTDENRIFYYGNYWNGKVLDENKETGIREADVLDGFDGKVVKKIGGKYSLKYALVEDN